MLGSARAWLTGVGDQLDLDSGKQCATVLDKKG